MRPHRFPPLAKVNVAKAFGEGHSPDAQASLAEGFQHGQQLGYREGYDTGLQRGRDDGQAIGRDEGRRAGAQEGKREALARLDQLAGPVDAILAALQQAQADYQTAMREEVVDLVARVARQVIRCELALQPVQLLHLVDETLATMPPPHDDVAVHLNPEDLRRIREVDPDRAARWTLVADAQLDAGECRVRAGRREADAGCRQRLAACMDQVRSQLLDGAPAGQAPAEVPAALPQPVAASQPIAQPAALPAAQPAAPRADMQPEPVAPPAAQPVTEPAAPAAAEKPAPARKKAAPKVEAAPAPAVADTKPAAKAAAKSVDKAPVKPSAKAAAAAEPATPVKAVAKAPARKVAGKAASANEVAA